MTRANGDGHEQLVRENTGRPSLGSPTNPDSTSMRLRKAETPPGGCPAKYEDRGLDVTAQSACSLGVLVQDTACPHRAWALWREPGLNGRGSTRVCPGVSGLARHLQNPGLSWGLGWAGWNLLPTSLDCTEPGMPTHPQAEDAHQVLRKETLGSHHLEARGSPCPSREHSSLKDVSLTVRILTPKAAPGSHGGPSLTHRL